MSTISVTKQTCEYYHIRNGYTWADIAFIVRNKQVDVLINSDYGHFAHNWISCGQNPKAFLCSMGKDYAMQKLSNYQSMEIDMDECMKDLKRSIIEARRNGELDAEQAREAWEQMTEDWDNYSSSYDIACSKLVDNEYFEVVFGDYEALPSSKRMKPECEGFWDKIWVPFVEELRREMI